MHNDRPQPLPRPSDPAATRWTALLRECEPRLRAYFLSRARNPADVDDLMQEVSVQLLRRGDDAGIEHMRAYLFQVAANVLNDHGRYLSSRRSDQHDAYDEDQHAVASEISIERIVIGEEALARIIIALRQLPQRTQDVFFLRAIRQRKHDEVAKLLGISTRVVQKHMTRALKHLTPVMRAMEDEA